MANVKVAVRVRPLSAREIADNGRSVVRVKEDCVAVTNLKVQERAEGDSRERVRRFAFDLCFDSSSPGSPGYASQEMVYQRLGCEVLDALLSGYNVCVLAYGQSGSGKTYTMAGGLGTDKNIETSRGLTPRMCEGLFARLRASTAPQKVALPVRVSFLEIYKERVRDLLQPDDVVSSPCRGAEPPSFVLKVREHPRHGPYVQGLSEHVVEDPSSLSALVSRGERARRTACTAGNPRSSRGHALLAISPRYDRHNGHHATSPRLHLVDLAGSERARQHHSEECSSRLKEGASINRSLVTLGNVISALAERCSPSRVSAEDDQSYLPLTNFSVSSTKSSSSPQKRAANAFSEGEVTPTFFVPYRDSVLTWLLKDSLGGNSKTVMVAAISPSSTCYNETISTLRYAQRTKNIVNRPVVYEDPNSRIIRELRAEVRKLRGMLLSVHMSESLHCREPDQVMTSLKEMMTSDGVGTEWDRNDGEGTTDGRPGGDDPSRNVQPFYLQGCLKEEDDKQAGGEPSESGEEDTPTASLSEAPPLDGSSRCSAMGREDSVASETMTEELSLGGSPPLCNDETLLPLATKGALPDPPLGTRSPLGRAFGGSCELVFSSDGHRVAESPKRPRGRSLPSGGLWGFRRQASMDAPNGPQLPRSTEDHSQSSSSVDSKGSADSSRLKTSKSPKPPVRGGRAFQVRTGVAEARRRAAEQARRRAEIVAAVTRRLYPNKRRAEGSVGADDKVEAGEASEGRTEAEGEAAADEGTPASAEAGSRARFRLLSRRALGVARKTQRPVSYATAVTQTEGGEMREAGVGTEALVEGLPLGPLARGVLTRLLISGPMKPQEDDLIKSYSDDSLESSKGSEEELSEVCPGRLAPASPGRWETSGRRARPLTDLFRECKNGGWGTWRTEDPPPNSVLSAPEVQPDSVEDTSRTVDTSVEVVEEARPAIPSLPQTKEKVREWQMRTLPSDSFEEETSEANPNSTCAEIDGKGKEPTDWNVGREDEDSWGDSSCDDASSSSADSDFAFFPPPPSTPAPKPPPIPPRRQLYTITENSEHSDFSDAASVEAVSRRSTPPSSIEHLREDWRIRHDAQTEEKTGESTTEVSDGDKETKEFQNVNDKSKDLELEETVPSRRDPEGDKCPMNTNEPSNRDAKRSSGEECKQRGTRTEKMSENKKETDCRFLNVSILGRPECAVPVSIGMAEGGPFWGSEGSMPTASEDSITFVFVGRPPYRRGSKVEGGAKCSTTLPPVLVELIRRSLGGEGRKRGTAWGDEEEGTKKGRRGLRKRHAPMRRSVSVDTAVRALCRFVRMQGISSNGRSASTECLVPEEVGAILEQGRLHTVGDEGCVEEGNGGGNEEGGGSEGEEEQGGPRCGTANSHEEVKGRECPLRTKVDEGREKRNNPRGEWSTAAEEEVDSRYARDKGGGSYLPSPNFRGNVATTEGDSTGISETSLSEVPRGREPRECPLPANTWSMTEEDDFDDDYSPPLPRVALGRTVLRESDTESRMKKMQLQDMRNVVFGFPDVEVEERPRERKAGAKCVSWGDEGATGGGDVGKREGRAIPRPIIKRTSSAVQMTAGRKSPPIGNSDEGPSRERLFRTKSPRPDGSYARCPVHSYDDSRHRYLSAENEDKLDDESSGEEFEERACRALSDFLVEATSLLEGLCKATGLSSNAERMKKPEEKYTPSASVKAESALDAKEVLAALQTRLSDRHLMRSPPKTASEIAESEAPYSLPNCLSLPPENTRESLSCDAVVPRSNAFKEYLGAPRLDTHSCHLETSEQVELGFESGTTWKSPSFGAINRSAEDAKTRRTASADSLGSPRFTSSTSTAVGDSRKSRLSELTCDSPSNACPMESIRRSDSEGAVAPKAKVLTRPTSPDLFPDLGSLRAKEVTGEEGPPSFGGFWSPNRLSRDEVNPLVHDRAWRSSNSLHTPMTQQPVTLRESRSDAALCSSKSYGGCCLHGQHHETRVHHHHHHYHHYLPFSERESNWEKRLAQLEQEDDPSNLWKGSAPQLSVPVVNPVGDPSDYTWHYNGGRRAESPGIEGHSRGMASHLQTPFSSAPSSPYRSNSSPVGPLPPFPLHHGNNATHSYHHSLPSSPLSPLLHPIHLSPPTTSQPYNIGGSSSLSSARSPQRQIPTTKHPFDAHSTHHLRPATLQPCSPTPMASPADYSYCNDPLAPGGGLPPHAYLRHLVGVRKEVVAATRSLNNSVSSPMRDSTN